MGFTVEWEAEELPEPRRYQGARTRKKIAVVDTETWGFKAGRVPVPFALGFWIEDGTYWEFWGLDCVTQFFAWLSERSLEGEEYLIYAHNGGKFDFHFFMEYLSAGQQPLIIDRRITRVIFQGQEFRDSYKILPFPLKDYQKDTVDYSWFEPHLYEKHRRQISAYLKSDCVYLGELVLEFQNLLGDKITIGQAAMETLNSIYGYGRMTARGDKTMRPWYMGGRCQYFERGIIRGDLKVYDVKSMYPYAMKAFRHPIGKSVELSKVIGPDTCFIKAKLRRNDGAIGQKTPDGYDFTARHGVFFMTIHEWNAAHDLDLIAVDKVLTVVDVAQQTDFAEWVDRFYTLKNMAEANGDKARREIYKRVLVNGYGKWAQNPENYRDFWLGDKYDVPPDYDEETRFNDDTNPGGWAFEMRFLNRSMWSKVSPNSWRGFRNVMTAASITGAARSHLMRGLAQATRPLYCDTDSIICESLACASDSGDLGSWAFEAEGDQIAIAGKKMYSLTAAGDPIKQASKGVNLTPAQILATATGAVIHYDNPVPNFRLGSTPEFVGRNVKRDAKNYERFGRVNS